VRGNGGSGPCSRVANMISANQVNVPERPNDLVGTLANTCMAKSLLGFQARKEFRKEMKEQVDAIIAKQASAAGEAGVNSGDERRRGSEGESESESEREIRGTGGKGEGEGAGEGDGVAAVENGDEAPLSE